MYVRNFVAESFFRAHNSKTPSACLESITWGELATWVIGRFIWYIRRRFHLMAITYSFIFGITTEQRKLLKWRVLFALTYFRCILSFYTTPSSKIQENFQHSIFKKVCRSYRKRILETETFPLTGHTGCGNSCKEF